MIKKLWSLILITILFSSILVIKTMPVYALTKNEAERNVKALTNYIDAHGINKSSDEGDTSKEVSYYFKDNVDDWKITISHSSGSRFVYIDSSYYYTHYNMPQEYGYNKIKESYFVDTRITYDTFNFNIYDSSVDLMVDDLRLLLGTYMYVSGHTGNIDISTYNKDTVYPISFDVNPNYFDEASFSDFASKRIHQSLNLFFMFLDENKITTKEGLGFGNAIPSTYSVESVRIKCEDNVYYAGETIYLYTKISPSNAGNTKVDWTSSDSEIASVNKDGDVKLKKCGTVIIKAEATDGSGVYGTIKLSIIEKPISKIKATINNVKIKGQNLNITWKKITQAKKYEIQISDDKKFKKDVKKKKISGEKTSVKIKYNKKGTVYIRIRVVDKRGKLGKWSKVKKITI